MTIFNEGSILKERLKKAYNLDQNKVKKIMKLNILVGQGYLKNL